MNLNNDSHNLDSEMVESEEQIDTDDESLNSSLESIDLNEHTVKRIKNNRNKTRINYGEHIGSLAFDVVWSDETITREPIQNLINKHTEEVNEYLIDIIDDYKVTAQTYPTNNRMCIMCFTKVYNGAIMCSNHCLKYPFLIE